MQRFQKFEMLAFNYTFISLTSLMKCNIVPVVLNIFQSYSIRDFDLEHERLHHRGSRVFKQKGLSSIK